MGIIHTLWSRTFGRSRWLKEKDVDTKRDLLGEQIASILDVAQRELLDFHALIVFCTWTSVGFRVEGKRTHTEGHEIATVPLRDIPLIHEAVRLISSNDPQSDDVVNRAIDEIVGEIVRQVYGSNLLQRTR